MVKTASTMLALGTQAPDFTLPDTVSGNDVSLSDFAGKPVLMMFICNHCPFVIHVREQIKAIGDEYQKKGVAVVAVSANDVSTHPDDSPDKMKAEAESNGYSFPYLYDESQETAKAYTAACTPDFFLFDADHKLVYRGQLDDSRPGSDVVVTGDDLRAAIDATLKGEGPVEKQMPSIGCNIKWKEGNAPAYFG